MAKISFYLTNPKSKDETTLFCLINYGLYSIENGIKKYLPLKYYTDISMIPDLWNKDLNRAKESERWASIESYDFNKEAVKKSAKTNYNKINKRISDFEAKAQDLINELSESGSLPPHEHLRLELDKIYKPTKIITPTNPDEAPKEFFPFINFFIKTSNRKYNTQKTYNTLKNNLLEFQKDKSTYLTFDKIDIDFYNSFVEYLTARGLAKSTIGTRIKILKTFMGEAHERGITVPSDYTKKSFKKPNSETFSIYLNETDLLQMYEVSGLPQYLERVRDLFFIGSYIGLRISDLSRLTKDNIESDNTINIKTKKTEQKVCVPIHPKVRAIFEKYNYQLPRMPSEQKFNDYIKLVCEKAKIEELTYIEINKSKYKIGDMVEKWKLVSSHTARRSFATNAYMADVPSISIMKITGHKTEASFMKYIKMSAKDNAIKMQSHKFFN
jgi:integrase